MLFNSLDFILFLPIVFCLFWITKNVLRIQNLIVVAASYVFYGWWDWRFLMLIILSTLVDFGIGLKMGGKISNKKRKLFLLLSCIFNLGVLCYFKYFGFFINSFIEAFNFLGFTFNEYSLNIVLPVGISFYTFQTMSYSIDVYRKKMEPTRDLIAFSAFVSFFPQLVAGPIERATNLLPQFSVKKEFSYSDAVDGLRQILWGFFKKLVIADNCAVYVNYCFNNPDEYSGSTLIIGAVFFAFQIYGDFSGYSDIAIGTSKLFGYKLNRNFAFPYFSRDVAEFWRRWHISLSTWFRDYLYIPLGGSSGGLNRQIRNTFIIFFVSGFWHGANWTFIFWGGLNALFFLPLLLTKRHRKHSTSVVALNKSLPSIKELFMMVSTFALITLAWVFFRAENVMEAFEYIYFMVSDIFSLPNFKTKNADAFLTMFTVLFFITLEWIGRRGEFGLSFVEEIHTKTIRWGIYCLIVFMIGMYMQTNETPFIYFQF
jgi:D-alanyl-lipoteichoic acid acyltransferase DltB (MBOAT superfamily)